MSSVTKLNGIDVKFPFLPYKLQIGYMSQLIRSAKNRKNALLESPTGTGKTLSILCAILAWLNDEIDKIKKSRQKNEIEDESTDKEADDFALNDKQQDDVELPPFPKVYFSSRTHSQLSQSIKELKKANPDQNTAVVLGGRDVLCLNDDVKKLDNIGAKNQACKSKIGANCSCKYYKDYDRKIKDTRDYKETRVFDVEDLVSFGEKHSICPYFASRSLQKKSNIVFLPYNYLLDPKIRKAQGLQFNDDVIIFDEGHNIEKTCEDSISVDLRSDNLAICIREMHTIYQFYQQSIENQMMLDAATLDAVKEFSTEDLLFLKQVFDDFEECVDSEVASMIQLNSGTKGDVCKEDWVFSTLKKCNLTFDNAIKVAEICDKIQAFLICILPVKGPAATIASSSLNSFKDFVNVLFPDESVDEIDFMRQFKQKFKVYLEIIEEEENKSSTSQNSQQTKNKQSGTLSNWVKAGAQSNQRIVKKWVLHIWCLSPSIGLKSLIKSNVRSLVLTSGTLAPLDSFEAEFDTKFECRIQNPHIIKQSQMAIYPVSYSYNQVRLDSTFKNKDNINYYQAMGDTIVDIFNNSPGGALVFFQSYAVMNNSIKKWMDNDRNWKIWTQLNKLKPVFLEKKSKEEFNKDVQSFRNEVDMGRGASFFAICRGKLSEGIDLGDRFSRSVILVGLPFPSTQDPRVKLKKSYLEQANFKNFTGNDWYMLQMKRALNQAVGRAIRHKDDYGAVFLLDYRFENQTGDLSKWCRDFVRRPATYQDMIIEVKKFFENNKTDWNRKAAVQASNNVKDEPDAHVENENLKVELDFSLSEYTSKSKSKQSNKKRPIYDSSLDERNKKAKQLPSNVSNMFDLFEPTSESTNNARPPKKQRRHISIEYDNAVNQDDGDDDLICLSEE